MFGYIKVNEPELKIREYATYRAYYCGLCRELKRKYGQLGRLTLTYDMTFFIMLLSSLYEPKFREDDIRCIVHPKKKRHTVVNEVTEYAADMNMILSYEHLRDDWKDEKKIGALAGENVLRKRVLRTMKEYPVQSKIIKKSLEKLARIEEEKSGDLDAAARPFGELMAGLVSWKRDPFFNTLKDLGFYLGKFIYILDAYLDYDKDKNKGCYNPFIYSDKFSDDAEKSRVSKEKVRAVLDHTLRCAIVEFEKLPLEQDVAILRNILYEGVWVEFDKSDSKGK